MTAKPFNYHKDDIEDHLEFESKATSKCHDCGTVSTIHHLICPNCSKLLRRSEGSMWSSFSSHPARPHPVDQTSELVEESEDPAKNIKSEDPIQYRRIALANDPFDEYPWTAPYGREEFRNLKQVPLTSGERSLNRLAQGFITFVMLLPYLLFLFVLICRKPIL